MKRLGLTIALTVACCLAATASLSAHTVAMSAPPCTPKITTIHGHQAAVNCGPATAILNIGGKAYTFHNGFCQKSKAAGSALQLALGTLVVGVKGNAGLPAFSMAILANGRSAFGSGSVLGADYGGRDLLGGEGLIKATGRPSNGTFTSTVAAGGKFTGSWNCHGAVWQGP